MSGCGGCHQGCDSDDELSFIFECDDDCVCKQMKKCTCDILVVMNRGCLCGAEEHNKKLKKDKGDCDNCSCK
jgi:hypothetical protein